MKCKYWTDCSLGCNCDKTSHDECHEYIPYSVQFRKAFVRGLYTGAGIALIVTWIILVIRS